MKLVTVALVSVSLFTFEACSKKNTTPTSDQSISFSMNGNSAVVTAITVDTSRLIGSNYPIIVVKGIATIAATKDTLTIQLQLGNDDNSWSSVKQFTGLFDDTTTIHRWAALFLNSRTNGNAYQDAGNGAIDFSVTIASNDGKIITGNFSGSVVTIANNTGAPNTMPIASGKFKLDL